MGKHKQLSYLVKRLSTYYCNRNFSFVYVFGDKTTFLPVFIQIINQTLLNVYIILLKKCHESQNINKNIYLTFLLYSVGFQLSTRFYLYYVLKINSSLVSN